MNTHECTHEHHHTDSTHRGLAKRMRLVGRLVDFEIHKAVGADRFATRGDVKVASKALDERIEAAVSADDLATTLATLDAIAEAFGGRDGLPAGPHGRGMRRGRPGRTRGRRPAHPRLR